MNQDQQGKLRDELQGGEVDGLSCSFFKKPVIIFGAGRSGTTLLHSLLDDHPELVVWPFEFSYYPEFERFRKRIGIPAGKPVRLSLLNGHFLARDDIQCLGDPHHFSMGVYMDLGKVNRKAFFDVMTSYPQDQLVSRKEYLLLLIRAYYEAFCPDRPVKGFVFCLQNIRDEVVADFTEAKYLWAYREPIDNYIATKKDYFVTADNKYLCYFPGKCNRVFRHGLMEVASWPVYYTHRWVSSHGSRVRILTVDLKELQGNPASVMKRVAEFVGIPFDESLLRATFAGVRFDSNLSSGEKSGGKILKTPLYNPAEHLSDFEYSYVKRKLLHDNEFRKYSFRNFAGFFRLLKNEFPEQLIVRKKKSGVLARLLVTAVTFVVAYLNNRFFFLFYNFPLEDPWE